jgi:hypothetical protein
VGKTIAGKSARNFIFSVLCAFALTLAFFHSLSIHCLALNFIKVLWIFCAVRCGLKRRIAKFLESKRDKERRGFFFYRSINRMHSYSEIVLKSWVEWLKDWVTVKTFLLVFCKARLVR